MPATFRPVSTPHTFLSAPRKRTEMMPFVKEGVREVREPGLTVYASTGTHSKAATFITVPMDGLNVAFAVHKQQKDTGNLFG